MATIYSLVIDSDGGTDCELFSTAAARDKRCHELCAEAWERSAAWNDDGPMPDNWQDAWEVLSESADWWLATHDHDMPELQLADRVPA
jgi:hypothetical protein